MYKYQKTDEHNFNAIFLISCLNLKFPKKRPNSGKLLLKNPGN